MAMRIRFVICPINSLKKLLLLPEAFNSRWSEFHMSLYDGQAEKFLRLKLLRFETDRALSMRESFGERPERT